MEILRITTNKVLFKTHSIGRGRMESKNCYLRSSFIYNNRPKKKIKTSACFEY